MLALVLRRALGQYRLAAAVVTLVAVAATLLGVCALLLGPTQDRAFDLELQSGRHGTDQGFAIDAFLVRIRNDDAPEVRETTVRQLRDVLGPLAPEVSSVASGPMRELVGPGDPRVGYLVAGDGVEPRSELVEGRWPEAGSGALETTVHEDAARLLGLAVGDRVRMGRTTGLEGLSAPLALEVVGVFRPASALGWESDPLTGEGSEVDYSGTGTEITAYGPFVVEEGAFLDSGSAVARLRVTARPDTSDADRASLVAAAAAYAGAGDRLAADLADQVQSARMTSLLPETLARVETERAASRSVVLVAVLLGATLSLTALLLAGRLVAAVRDEERVLLVAFGASPRQQLVAAGFEAVLLALAAAAVAVPASALVHSRLTHLAAPAAAGLAQAPTITVDLVLTVLGSALALAPVLVLTAVDTSTTTAATRRRWALGRAPVDWGLVIAAAAAAGLAWWQLRDRPEATTGRADVTLTLAPVVFLVATTLVVLRLVPVLLRLAATRARRSPRLALPLSAQQAARRPHPTTAMALIATAVATAAFGLGLGSTWERSQVDQADLRVGTDLSLEPVTAPTGAAAEAVLAAVEGRSSAVSVVIDRTLTIGRYAGTTDAEPPTLVALDSAVAGDLLRGRFDGGSWASMTDGLDPGPAVGGVTVSDGAVTLLGRTDNAVPMTATATAVVEGAAGLRHTLTAAPVPIDGEAHELTWADPVTGLRVVALSLHLDQRRPRPQEITAAGVDLTVTLPGTAEGDSWHAHPQDRDPVADPEVATEPSSDRLVLRASARADTGRIWDGGGDLVVTSFPGPDAVPVALSDDLADTIGAEPGEVLEGILSGARVPLEVVGVVPDVPSAPGQPAVLADADAVTRSLLAGGQFEPFVDAWWVGEPTADAEQALVALDLGPVFTRAGVTEELTRGPFGATVLTVLAALVAAAAVLLLAGIALVTSADRRRRAVELTRLRALGLTRRGAQQLLVAEHATSLAPLVLLGLAVGWVASWAIGPLMVRSDVGAAPVPPAVLDWPWAAATVVLGGAVLGSMLIAWLVAVRQVRASDRAGLRTGDA